MVNDVQASIVPVIGNRRMPVFSGLDDRGVESCVVEGGLSKSNGWKGPRLDQCTMKLKKKDEHC